MSAKHTPGPWFFRGTELRTRAAMGRSNSRDGWIVPLGEQANYERIKHGDAAKNRAVIENAPKLVAALRKLTELMASGMLVNHRQLCSERRDENGKAFDDAYSLLLELGEIES